MRAGTRLINISIVLMTRSCDEWVPAYRPVAWSTSSDDPYPASNEVPGFDVFMFMFSRWDVVKVPTTISSVWPAEELWSSRMSYSERERGGVDMSRRLGRRGWRRELKRWGTRRWRIALASKLGWGEEEETEDIYSMSQTMADSYCRSLCSAFVTRA